jgi:hypothetical protein
VTPRRRRPLSDTFQEALEADPGIVALGIEAAEAAEIRLLCPRGHFIAYVAVIVFDGEDRRVLLRPRGRDRQHFGDTYSDPNHGFRFDDEFFSKNPKLRVRLHCLRPKCDSRRGTPYDGSFDFLALGKELRKAVLAGHAEYRVTN